MVLRPGEAETEGSMAVLYSSSAGQIQRTVEMELSQPPGNIRRITQGKIEGGSPAIYISSSANDNAIISDVLALKDGRFVNLAAAGEANISIETLLNHYVYADDIDNDGIMELPSLITMKSISSWDKESQKFLLRWFSLDENGWEIDKLFTFHNYVGGWYVQLGSDWASRVTVDQNDGVYSFYVWDESYQNATGLFTLYIFNGSTRDEDAVKEGRFALHRAEGVAYAARIEPAAAEYGITEEHLIESFRLIRQDWQSGET